MNASDDGDDNILASGKKRKREKTNYSEKEMLKGFDFADYYSDNNSTVSEYDIAENMSDDDDDDEEQFENEDLTKIVKVIKHSHTKKDERHRWGGASSTDWTKDGKQLQIFPLTLRLIY